MVKMEKILDANMILRFLLNDNIEMSKQFDKTQRRRLISVKQTLIPESAFLMQLIVQPPKMPVEKEKLICYTILNTI